MMELVIVLGILILFAVVAGRWGYDSRDGIESLEWERRTTRDFPDPSQRKVDTSSSVKRRYAGPNSIATPRARLRTSARGSSVWLATTRWAS